MSASRRRFKIIDFGSAVVTHDCHNSYVQSRWYRAPEVMLGLPWDEKVDVWGVGCIVAELLPRTWLTRRDGLHRAPPAPGSADEGFLGPQYWADRLRTAAASLAARAICDAALRLHVSRTAARRGSRAPFFFAPSEGAAKVEVPSAERASCELDWF